MKKSMKKILCTFMVVLMVLMSVPVSGLVVLELPKLDWGIRASALSPSGSCGNNATYTFDSDTGEVVISGTGTINPYFFSGSKAKSVVIEYGITIIGTMAFYNCDQIESITIPDSVKEIGYGAFLNTAYYKNSANWEDGLLYIDKYLICADSSIRDCNIKDETIGIATLAFGECDNLSNIVIPSSVKFITDAALAQFLVLSKTNNIMVDADNAYYTNDEYGVLFNKDKTELVQYPSGKENESYTIPDSVTTIRNGAFGSSKNLKNVIIPDSVTNIYNGAFLYSGITSVVIPSSVTCLHTETFFGCDNLASITIPDSVTNIELAAFSYCPVTDIYYGGTELEWNAIENISYSKDDLANATIHYNSHTHKYGLWYTAIAPTVFEQGEERRDCSCGEYLTRKTAKLTSDVKRDHTTGVEITYSGDNFSSDFNIIISENPINANIAFGDYENFKVYNITLEANDEKIQPIGKVTVKLPVPVDYDKDNIVVYYIDDSGNKTIMESKVENNCIIFETDHFSEYVIVDLSSKKVEHTHEYTTSQINPTCTQSGSITYSCTCGDTYTDTIPATGHSFSGSLCTTCGYDRANECSCNCHKSGIAHFFFTIINFFQKLFGNNKVCACGAIH